MKGLIILVAPFVAVCVLLYLCLAPFVVLALPALP